MRRAGRIGWLAIAVVLSGCSAPPSDPGSADDVGGIEVMVAEGFADQKNVIVRSTTCSTSTDANHFDCDVNYETPEGVRLNGSASVTCDADRCVWRER